MAQTPYTTQTPRRMEQKYKPGKKTDKKFRIKDIEPEDEAELAEKIISRPHSEVWAWIRAIVWAVLIALILHSYVISFAMVGGPSMEPLLYSGEVLAMDKLSPAFSPYRHGDIVICNFPHRPGLFIKRIVGVEGDTMEFRDGALYRNGALVEEDYLAPGRQAVEMQPVQVGEDALFVLSDNRDGSLDSRHEEVGTIQREQVLGRALFIIWPFGSIRRTPGLYQ